MEKKTYRMLKTVQGSHDGLSVQAFRKGEIHQLDESLAEQFYHQGAVEEVAADETPVDPKAREKKVVGPKETKDESRQGEAGVDPDTQHIEELVAVARDKFGLEVDSTMPEGEIRKLIEHAQGEAEDEDDDHEDEDRKPGKSAKKQPKSHK